MSELKQLTPAERKAFEDRAVKEAFQPPTPGDMSMGDEALIAMLAGATAQSLRNTKINATGAADVLNPRAVVDGLRRAPAVVPAGAPAVIPGTSIPVPLVPGSIPADQASTAPAQFELPTAAPRVPSNDPQLELALFKKMDMTDVYNKLDEMHGTLESIKKTQDAILKFMEQVQNA